MEQPVSPELLPLDGLVAAILTESVLLQKMILSEGDEREESAILCEFDNAIEAQAFSTLTNLNLYQLRGWRGLADG